MPRTQIMKARAAATTTRRQRVERPLDLNKQATVLIRVLVRIYDILMTYSARAAIIEVEKDVFNHMLENSAKVGDRIGPRFIQTVHQAIARLVTNGYIEYIPHNDDVEKFRITEHCQSIIQELVDRLREIRVTFATYSDEKKHRYKCAFFTARLRSNLKRNATRRELDVENRRLTLDAKSHARICPVLQVRSNSVVTEATELIDQDQTHNTHSIPGPSRTTNDSDNGDSVYVDDVPRVQPVASGSKPPMPQTPIRREHTLNNPGAYPSPESLARQNPPAPLTPERTPSRSSRSRSLSTQPTDPVVDMDVDDDDGEEELPRLPTVLFNQHVPDPVVALNEEITGLMAEIASQDAMHQERLAVLQVENNDRLAAQKVELDEQLAALKNDFEEQLVTKTAETDWSWLGKLNALRRTFRFQRHIDSEHAKRHLRQQEARSQRQQRLLADRIRVLEEEQEQQRLREQALRDQIAELEARYELERQGLLDQIRELKEEKKLLQGENQSLRDASKRTAQISEQLRLVMQNGLGFTNEVSALHQ